MALYPLQLIITGDWSPGGQLAADGGGSSIVNLVASVTSSMTLTNAALFQPSFNQDLSQLEVLVNAGRHDLIIEQEALNSEFVVWLDEASQPQDLSNWAAKLQVRGLQRDGEVLLTLTSPAQLVITPVDGKIEIRVTESESAPLDFDIGVYDLLMYPPSTPVDNYLLEAGTEFTSAAVDAVDVNGRAVVTLTGGAFNFSLLAGDVVHIYNTENAGVNDGVYTVYSSSSTVLTLTGPMVGDNSADTTIKIQKLDKENVVRLIEGNVFLHRRVTEA